MRHAYALTAPIILLAVLAIATIRSSGQCDFKYSDRFKYTRFGGLSSTTAIAEPASLGGRLLIFGRNDTAYRMRYWDGQDFTEFAPGYSEFVDIDVAYVETGANSELYSVTADATLMRLRRWDGAAWQVIGTSPTSGEARIFVLRENGIDVIYVAVGGNPLSSIAVPRILKWDGTSFVNLGWTISTSGFIQFNDLVLFDDGTGPKLVAAIYGEGPKMLTGGVWQPIGTMSGLAPYVLDLEVIDRGAGPELWAGGLFGASGGSNLARWTGTVWQSIGSPDGSISDIAAFDDGNGVDVFVAGDFSTIGGQPIARSARIDGNTFSALPGKKRGSDDRFAPRMIGTEAVLDVIEISDGALTVPRWNGTMLVHADELGLDATVYAMLRHDDGNGEKLWIGGGFAGSSATKLRGIATFDGTSYAAPGDGLLGAPYFNNITYAMCAYNSGTGDDLYAGGEFLDIEIPNGTVAANSIARWNGSTWSGLGSGVTFASGSLGFVYAMAVFDAGSGPELYVGGRFNRAGGTPANNLAAWNGTSWRAVSSGTNGPVNSLCVFNGQLLIGGSFTTAGGQPCFGFARSNGTTLTSIAGGLGAFGSYVNAMHRHDDGSGEKLVVGGYFNSIEGFAASSIAAWNGTAWSALGIGIADPVYPAVASLTTFDDGSGPALYVGGFFESAGGVPANRIARYKDGTWTPLDGGVDYLAPSSPFPVVPVVWALMPFKDPRGGEALYFGGNLDTADGTRSEWIGRWEADPANSACAVLGASAESAVGETAGGPFDLLRVQGRTGNGHRVNVALQEPLTIEITQPPTVPYSTGILLFGFIGTPTAADVTTLPLGLGPTAFAPCPLTPLDTRLFVLADDFGFGCAPLVPAGGTPWTLNVPSGVGFPYDFALQAIVGDLSATYGIAKTNAVLVSVR